MLVWLGLAGQLVAYLADARTVDLDVFHQMSLIREALASGAIPRTDVFAYTRTLDPVVHHEWGTGALLYAAWHVAGAGPSALAIVRYALVAAITGLAYACARRRRATAASIAVLGPIAMFLLVVAVYSPVRAGAFTTLFVAILLVLLEVDRTGGRWWILPWLVLHVVWVNMHGGFVVGFAVVGAAAAERFTVSRLGGRAARTAAASVGHLVWVAAAMALLALLNPYGWEYVSYLWRAILMYRPSIPEWAPPWDARGSRALLAVYCASLVVLLSVIWLAGRRTALSVSGWALVLGSSLAAASSVRHLPLHALAWLAYVAPLFARTQLGAAVERWSARVPVVAGASVAFAVLGGWTALGGGASTVTIPGVPDRSDRWYPVGAVEYLSASRFEGRLLTRFEDGSYVSWKLHPAVRVSFDSRYEAAYPQGTFERHAALFAAADGWEAVLRRDPADAILVPVTSPLGAALDRRAADWRCVYRDRVDTIYVRRLGAGAARGPQ